MSKIEKFDCTQETWQRFVDRLKLFFVAEGIDEEDGNLPNRRAKLLQLMGIPLYNQYRDVVGETEETFDQIVARVETLVNPAPLEIAEQYRFLNRRQSSTESAAEYMTVLRKMSLTCNFQNNGNNSTNARLRDQFVCGLADTEMQKFLLQQPQLTIDNVVNMATMFESAEKTSEMMRSVTSSTATNLGRSEVSAVRSTYRQKKEKKKASDNVSDDDDECRYCKKKGHKIDDCWQKKKLCFNCQKKRHMAKNCLASQEVSHVTGNESDNELVSDSNFIQIVCKDSISSSEALAESVGSSQMGSRGKEVSVETPSRGKRMGGSTVVKGYKESKSNSQRQNHRFQQFDINDFVWVRNKITNQWVAATIIQRVTSYSYLVKADGQVWFKYSNQLKSMHRSSSQKQCSIRSSSPSVCSKSSIPSSCGSRTQSSSSNSN